MTMEHIARSFNVTLFVEHPSIDPAEITNAIGLLPKRTTRAGSSRTTPKGQPLTGEYQFSCWSHEFDVQEAVELCRVLENLVEDLQSHGPFFHRMVQEGGTVELFCRVFAAGNWDEVLPHPLMRDLAGLRIDLRLDVYPSEDQPAAVRAWSAGRTIYLELVDGRIFGFPADRYRILSQATDDQLSRVQIELNGLALRWEELDEDLTVPGVIAGRFQLPLPEQPRGGANE